MILVYDAVAGARTRLRRPDRSVDASRPPAAAGDGGSRHARARTAWPCSRPIRTSSRSLRRRRASWSTRFARIVSTTTSSSPTARPANLRASAVPLDHKANARELTRVRACAAHARLRHRRLPSRPGDRRTGPHIAQPVVNDVGVLTLDRLRQHRSRLGVGIHRTRRPAAEHGADRSGRPGHRPVSIGRPGEVRRDSTPERGPRRSIPHRARAGFAGLDGVERLYVAEPLEFRGQHTGTRVTLGIALAPYRAALNAALRRNIVLLARRNAAVLRDCVGRRRSAVPARGPSDHRHRAPGLGRRPRGAYRLWCTSAVNCASLAA